MTGPFDHYSEGQLAQALPAALAIVRAQVCDGADGESAHLVARAAELYKELYEATQSRLEHEQLDHEYTRGYRQHAEMLLEEAFAKIERLEWRA